MNVSKSSHAKARNRWPASSARLSRNSAWAFPWAMPWSACAGVPLAEVRFLTIVIAIQQQAGGNLSEALGNLSGVLRDRFRLQLKVKALSAEAKASAMVLASLPPGVMSMVYMTSPEYITPLFTTTPGKFMLAVGAGWMMCGVLIMRKMINFKF